MKLWDIQQATELRTFEGHSQSVSAVAVLRDGRRACTVRLRGAEEGELLVGPDLAPALADALAATLD